MQSNFAFKLGETKMTDRVHGGVVGGEFLTGKMDFFSFGTSLPMAATGVNTPVKDLYQISDAVWTPVTVNGVTYNTKADYLTAFKEQQNLNIFMNVFAGRANPVIISVSQIEDTYGNIVNMATEKTGLWYVDDGIGNYGNPALDTNYTGYKFEDAFDGVMFWATGDNAETGSPTAELAWSGVGQNATVARRIAL